MKGGQVTDRFETDVQGALAIIRHHSALLSDAAPSTLFCPDIRGTTLPSLPPIVVVQNGGAHPIPSHFTRSAIKTLCPPPLSLSLSSSIFPLFTPFSPLFSRNVACDLLQRLSHAATPMGERLAKKSDKMTNCPQMR